MRECVGMSEVQMKLVFLLTELGRVTTLRQQVSLVLRTFLRILSFLDLQTFTVNTNIILTV